MGSPLSAGVPATHINALMGWGVPGSFVVRPGSSMGWHAWRVDMAGGRLPRDICVADDAGGLSGGVILDGLVCAFFHWAPRRVGGGRGWGAYPIARLLYAGHA